MSFLSQDFFFFFVDFIYFPRIGKHHVFDNKEIAKTFVLNCTNLGDWKKKKGKIKTVNKKLISKQNEHVYD